MVGRSICGKTTFAQKLAVNNIFGKLGKTKWASQTRFLKQCKTQIQSCFNCQLDFHYPKNTEELDDLLEEF